MEPIIPPYMKPSKWYGFADESRCGWQSIDSAPKDGTRVLCWKDGWYGAQFLCWKTNHRIVDAHKLAKAGDKDLEYSQSYFGDREEYDDYPLALPGNAPTHWLVIPDFPKGTQ